MLCSNGCGRDAGEWANRKRSRSYCGDACQREAMKAYQRAYKQRHKERLDQMERERYQREKELRIERQKERYEANPEKARRYGAEYYALHKDDPDYKERGREVVNRRRARQRGAYRENVERQKVWERDEGVCGICGEGADMDDWHLDHIIPLGPGEHSYENVRVAHPRCNIAKGADDKRVLAQWQDFRKG